MARTDPEQREAIRARLAEPIPAMLRLAADEIERCAPTLPSCPDSTCACFSGGTASVLLLMWNVFEALSNTYPLVDAWDDDAIDQSNAADAARRNKIAKQN